MAAMPMPMAILRGVENLRPHLVPKSHMMGKVSTQTKKGLTACQTSGGKKEVLTKSRANRDIEVPF